MHRPLPPPERRLQRAAWVVLAPFAFAGAQALLSAAWAGGLVVMREYASASSCLAHFGGGKIRQTPCVLFLAKIINKKSPFYIAAAAKNL